MSSLFVPLLALAAGVLIGAVGIGGIVLVSGLIYIAGLDAATVIAACMLGYLLTGAVGTWIYAGKGAIRWRDAGWLSLGAAPTAFAGAWAINTLPSSAIELGIGLLTAGAGLHALAVRHAAGTERTLDRPVPLAGIGAITGFGSAVTGTGGPLLLVPILIWLRVPVLAAIGLSQAIQLPIAFVASIGNALYGALDVRLGAMLAIALAAGAWIGARIAHLTPRETLRTAVAVVLAIVGSLIVVRLAWRALA